MAPNETPDDEVAAIDAVFEELPASPIKAPPPPPKPPDVSVPEPPPVGEALPRKSPPKDYLRELKQEFEDQENEGKL